MAERKRAKLFRNGGSQAVRLPAEFRFEGDEVYISRDEETGDIILSSPRSETGNWYTDYLAYVDSLDISEEDWKEWDKIMAERPMNVPYEPRDLFGDEDT